MICSLFTCCVPWDNPHARPSWDIQVASQLLCGREYIIRGCEKTINRIHSGGRVPARTQVNPWIPWYLVLLTSDLATLVVHHGRSSRKEREEFF